MTTFLEAYATHGPDVQAIATAMGITPPAADRLINDHMNRRYAEKVEAERQRLAQRRRDHNARIRAGLREIRGRHA